MSNNIVIVGAGPYGLSLAAHLRARGVAFRLFGKPMFNWQAKMPRGMLLKSEGFASNLADPDDSLTLDAFCAERQLFYADEAYPVPREDFIDYGVTFQQRFVPEVEERLVVSVRRSGDAFAVQLDDGEIVAADKVVIGIGISDFAHLPPLFAGCPEELVTHSARHAALDCFRGREVAVIGSGSSAIDVAALLHEQGAAVQLISRREELPFHSPPPQSRTLSERLRAPQTGIGPGWRSFFYTEAPLLFHQLPPDLRWRIVSTWLGPAGGWYMRERIEGRVACRNGCAPHAVELVGGKVNLHLTGVEERSVTVDHVIAATGYRLDVGRIAFLDETLRRAVSVASGFPV
ncbi:MAG: SidA/IucD/PvdA family monooxygenase, partial [Alphaproteobacteria bacterium]|nr:SidA/IucD/PvdA family monooxygenase [Alphaproteobacteria bacterium]